MAAAEAASDRPPDPFDSPYLDPSFVAEVVATPDILARNAAITRGYHALSDAVAALLGRSDANWQTFGQWASAEARLSMTGEAVPRFVRPIVGDDVAEAVGEGNAAVFGDVAPLFIAFVQAARPFAEQAATRRAAAEGAAAGAPSRAVDRAAVGAAVTAALSSVAGFDGSDDLRRAFAAYVDAFVLEPGSPGAPDPEAAERRAQRMLVANASIGAHEQQVVDPYVKAAIPGRSILAMAATARMGILVPEGLLRLSRDVPPPAYLGGPTFPAALLRLSDPEALALAERFGQDPGSAADSDAPDWEDYRERMGFIFTFLRAYQQHPGLFTLPPGTPEP
jgi:hypothetical protein